MWVAIARTTVNGLNKEPGRRRDGAANSCARLVAEAKGHPFLGVLTNVDKKRQQLRDVSKILFSRSWYRALRELVSLPFPSCMLFCAVLELI